MVMMMTMVIKSYDFHLNHTQDNENTTTDVMSGHQTTWGYSEITFSGHVKIVIHFCIIKTIKLKFLNTFPQSLNKAISKKWENHHTN